MEVAEVGGMKSPVNREQLERRDESNAVHQLDITIVNGASALCIVENDPGLISAPEKEKPTGTNPGRC